MPSRPAAQATAAGWLVGVGVLLPRCASFALAHQRLHGALFTLSVLAFLLSLRQVRCPTLGRRAAVPHPAPRGASGVRLVALAARAVVTGENGIVGNEQGLCYIIVMI